MKKRFLLLTLVLLFAVFLVSCKNDPTPTPTPTLTAITFSGVADATLEFQEEFNVLTGVTALGNDGVDYTSEITYTSTSTISASHMLDTSQTGNHAIRYEVEVGTVKQQSWRYITVKSPTAGEGEYLVNPDFEDGTAGWVDPNVNYIADGAAMTITAEDGTLRVDVVAGTNMWTPRFGQMNVPFEQDTTYEISFKAKSSVNKTINLQVGELLTSDPWFTDFKPNQSEQRLITTEWATYSYKFTHTQDNKRGGILFELGTVGGQAIDATLWFDDIVIVESTPDDDVDGPVLSGVQEVVNVTVGSTYDPAAGVTAYDLTDGDVTDQIVITIKNSLDEVVTSIDTSEEATFTVTYYVKDSLDNETEFIATVNVVSMLFSDTNLVVNPSFEEDLDETTPEWFIWSEGFTVVADIDTTEGVYTVDISGTGPNPYSVQLVQENQFELVEGATYRLMFTAKASVARSINVTAGIGLDADPWYITYMRKDAIALTTDFETYEVLFTVTQPTAEVKIVFEMGMMTGFAEGIVTFDEVAIQQAELPEYIANSDFSDVGFYLWHADGITSTLDMSGGNFAITTDLPGEAGWTTQFNQHLDLEANKTYEFKFDAMASVARDINVKVFKPGVWVFHVEELDYMLTTEIVTYTIEFTTGADNVDGLTVSFEMGLTDNFAAGTVTLDNISLKEKVAEAPELIVNGNTETVVGGHMYDNSGEAATGQMVWTVDGAEITVLTVGPDAWTPHYYYMVEEMLPGEYTIVLRLTADVVRDLRVNIVLPDSGYASIFHDEFVTVEDEMVYVVFNFTVANPLTNIKIELDFGTLGEGFTSLPGVFTLHEIFIYQNLN
jgi:hypothetical protein